MKTYAGSRLNNKGDSLVVMVQDTTTGPPYQTGFLRHVVIHSPTGFEWGYGGSGPADLALSILTDYFEGEQSLAEVFYQEFKHDIVSKFPRQAWTLTSETIKAWIFNRTSKFPGELLAKYRIIKTLNGDVARQFLGDLRCKK